MVYELTYKVVDNGMMPHEGASLVNVVLFISRYLANQKA